MRTQLQISRVEDCFNWLELSSKDYTSTQSISWLIDHVGELCNSLAFVNQQMATAKQILNKAKVKAYQSLMASTISHELNFAPSLAKDYIASKIDQEQYDYDICERCSRTIYHFLEMLRSCISALKMESQISNYQQI
ncbi:MAG: hypothetical protein NVS3B19_09630 [Ginsengibacter sp.]